MTELRQRMLEDMQLRGLSPRTQKAYVAVVRQLAEHYGKPPADIDEEELRRYFLYLKNEKKVSRSTCTQALCGIKFFYERTLRREWKTFDLVRPPKEKKLPVVLSVEEVAVILNLVRMWPYRVCLGTIYACGLRASEGISLEVGDIDGQRRMVHVRGGKGGKDRYVPLPERMLQELRGYWRTHRHPQWLFPSWRSNGAALHAADKPMHVNSVQRAFKAALQESGVGKMATVHTLRHSWATHMLEAGVNLRVIQVYLGHSSPKTTALYMHLTRPSEAIAVEAMEHIMEALPW